ncbi:MAG TPA: hypothetical protein VND22_07245 [Actinomycetota bacterium]|nr:hypothetical protein [Actinomycetota bacterium]
MASTAKNPPTIQQARAAKLKAESLLARNRRVNGIGIARLGTGWCVKVNLSGPTRAVLPEEIDGVPLRIEQVGEISKR